MHRLLCQQIYHLPFNALLVPVNFLWGGASSKILRFIQKKLACKNVRNPLGSGERRSGGDINIYHKSRAIPVNKWRGQKGETRRRTQAGIWYVRGFVSEQGEKKGGQETVWGRWQSSREKVN